MATKRREQTINRHKLAVIQAYTIIAIFVLIGVGVGFFIGRATAPKAETVKETVTETVTVEVPTYEQDKLPELSEIYYFDIPLSHSLQRYIYEVCADEEVPVTLVIAMIEQESQFNPEEVSATNDYGLMQINEINHDRLEEEYWAADMLNPYQNVFCGVKLIAQYLEEYDGDFTKALMSYNMGHYGAIKAWQNGMTSSSYSRSVLELMSKYEQEVKNHAESSVNE